MTSSACRLLLIPAAAVCIFAAHGMAAVKAEGSGDSTRFEFFEKNIRPVLVNKCYKCHSTEADKSKGGLLLDTREATLQGGDSGHGVVPGNPKESLVLEALKWANKDLRMPPEKEGGKLPDNVIADFEKWIAMGAPDPRGGAAPVAKKTIDPAKAKEFWAFKAPAESAAPTVKDTAWPLTDVDHFILAAQEAKGLHPVADADKRSLIRRVYFDLLGLPPTPEQIDAFLKDASPDAFAKVVDGLLASTHFGERWGRHWLDVARYAESTGKERNFTSPTAWRYRDYVIASFNQGKPYDQFIREQIAGDLAPAKDVEQRNAQLIATGFLALGPKSLNEKNKEQFRADLVDEQIDVTSRAVLGLTVACARCHDHKFDPISQSEYYSLAGIFRSTETHYGVSNYNPKKPQRDRNPSTLITLASDQPESTETSAAAATPIAPAQQPPAAKGGLPANFEQQLAAVAASRPKLLQRLKNMTREQKIRAYEKLAEKGLAKAEPAPAAPAPAPAAANAAQKKKNRAALQNATAATPKPAEGAEQCMGVSEGRVGDAKLLVRGEISQPSGSVARGFLNVIGDPAQAPKIPENQSGRSQLADWLVSKENPLTARVAVNRVWAKLFGEGLVDTPDNFGTNGGRPSHPELLDHLALQFMREGWSTKALIRSLVLSRTYQLSTANLASAQEVDPDNRLLWRASPRRLDAEAIRDAILVASGTLETAAPRGSVVANVGDGYIGRGIRPEIFINANAKYRSVYLPIVRDCVPEMLEAFDFAEPSLVVAARDVTNVPSQALFLMNNTFVREQSAAMARRILAAPLDHAGRIGFAYELALGRPPTESERARAASYLLNEARGLVPVKAGDKAGAAELSWSTFCQALFASAEFRYLK